MQVINDDIQFDSFGRMVYHPDFHENHRKPFLEEELEYLCKYWEVDDLRNIAYALGRTEHTLSTRVSGLKKQGLYEHYKNLNKHW